MGCCALPLHHDFEEVNVLLELLANDCNQGSPLGSLLSSLCWCTVTSMCCVIQMPCHYNQGVYAILYAADILCTLYTVSRAATTITGHLHCECGACRHLLKLVAAPGRLVDVILFLFPGAIL